MSIPLIGILGAYGAVGRSVVSSLRRHKAPLRLRLGGRSADSLAALGGWPDEELLLTEALDPAALVAMCSGCQVVINCAGPMHILGDRVGRAALAAGADYVDPAESAFLLAGLGALASGAPYWRGVLSAGMLPGLSGILPRWLAQGMDPGASLTAHIGVLDHFSPASAEDYLEGLGSSDSMAAWQDGRLIHGAARRVHGVDLPYFPPGLTVHPYLDNEGARLAQDLGLKRAQFYNVLDGEHAAGVLAGVAGRTLDSEQLRAKARDLAAAAELDLAGRKPYLIYLYQLEGANAGVACTRTLMVRADSAAPVTGAVVALSAEALLAGEVVAGVNNASAVLDPAWAVQRLRAGTALSAWEMLERKPQEAAIEEGSL